VRKALTNIPGLAHETEIPYSAINNLDLDPMDPSRAAFELHCGWSGTPPPLPPTSLPC